MKNYFKKNLIDFVVLEMNKEYEHLINEANETHIQELGEGKERKCSQNLTETILEKTISKIAEQTGKNLTLKRGERDYFKKTITRKDGTIITDDKIQVDFNLYHNETLIAVIEVKTNLDKCYLKRAVMDFEEIASAINQKDDNPSKIKYILFCGQTAVDDNTLKYYNELFKEHTAMEFGKRKRANFETHFILNGVRNSKHKIIDYDPGINNQGASEFVNSILTM